MGKAVDIGGFDVVVGNLEKYKKQTLEQIKTRMEYVMAECEDYGKDRAPWTDRSGNARDSIFGRIIEATPEEIVGAMGIGVDYGLYLEMCNQGRFRIVWPTIEANKHKLLEILK